MREIAVAIGITAIVLVVLGVVIYGLAVLIAHFTDRWEKRIIPSRQRSSIVPATTSMIDTDEYDTDDVHPETITQMVARIEAEEQAVRDAKRAQV